MLSQATVTTLQPNRMEPFLYDINANIKEKYKQGCIHVFPVQRTLSAHSSKGTATDEFKRGPIGGVAMNNCTC